MTLLDANHTFTITVNGADVTRYLTGSSLRIQTVLGAELDTCTFDLEDYDNALGAITSWLPVTVEDESANVLFAGYAAQVRAQLGPGGGHLIWTLTCLDYGVLLQKRIVDSTFTETTAASMIGTLVAAELGAAGYDGATYVATGGTYTMRFDRRTLFDCIQELASKDEYIWWVDTDKALHYIAEASATAAPFAIAPLASCDWSTTFPAQGALSVEEDASDIRNAVAVHGGVTTSDPLTEFFVGDGVTTDFTVSHAPINATNAVLVNGAVQETGRDFIDDPTKFAVLINWSYGVLKFADPPAAGAAIQIVYTYDEAVRVTVNDAASQATYGVHEYVHVDPAIASEAEATFVAEAILRRYKNPTTSGRLTVERLGLAAGQKLSITNTALGWTAREFIIQSATTSVSRKGVQTDVQFGTREPSLLQVLRGVAGSAGGIATGGIGSGAGTALGERLDLRQPTGYQFLSEPDSGVSWLVPVYNVTVGDGILDFSDEDNSGYWILL